MEEKHDHNLEVKYNTPNDLNLKVVGVENQELINEECCTCINVILQNNGNIQTSFLGAHNPEIVQNLEKAMKLYFKGLKKALKQHFIDDENIDECCDENSHECCCEHTEKQSGKNKKDKCCCEKNNSEKNIVKDEKNNKKSKTKKEKSK